MKSEDELAAALSISVKRLAHARKLPLPAYQTRGAAGLDLVAAVPARRADHTGAEALARWCRPGS